MITQTDRSKLETTTSLAAMEGGGGNQRGHEIHRRKEGESGERMHLLTMDLMEASADELEQ